MKKVNILKLNDPCYPQILKDIPSAPKQIFWLGNEPSLWLDKPRVAIVGSRKASPYGRQVTQKLAGDLAGAGVVIISGLALGIDAIAHQSSLEVGGGITVAVLPTSLDRIYPASHLQLARQIMEQGGTLISEYPEGSETFKVNFVARNRIVSGLADVLLITEAAVNSGTLHTARFALEQGKTVMVVPGNITHLGSIGCNNLIKSGAIPVTETADIFFELGIKPEETSQRTFKGSQKEQAVLELIREGVSSQEELALATKLDGASINSVLTMLEINGHIKAHGSGNWSAS